MQRSGAGSKQGHAEQLRGSQAWHGEATEKGFFSEGSECFAVTWSCRLTD